MPATLLDSIVSVTALRSLALDGKYQPFDLYNYELPPTISRLSSLQQLVLTRYQRSSLPESIGGLNCLEGLAIRSSSIEGLHPSLCNLDSLQRVDLSGC